MSQVLSQLPDVAFYKAEQQLIYAAIQSLATDGHVRQLAQHLGHVRLLQQLWHPARPARIEGPGVVGGYVVAWG
ncbi:hypothetical protein EON63_20835 [archaeon]|nr:MAG: hypothetical protein EON63_20835 [archaeon]